MTVIHLGLINELVNWKTYLKIFSWQLPIELLRPTKTHIDTNELFYVLDSGNNRSKSYLTQKMK